MTVCTVKDAIILEGRCGVEDVDDLLRLLESGPARVVDLSAAGAVHTALWQALMMHRPVLRGVPADGFFAALVLPLLAVEKPAAGKE